jgi:hypothetical protein
VIGTGSIVQRPGSHLQYRVLGVGLRIGTHLPEVLMQPCGGNWVANVRELVSKLVEVFPSDKRPA